MPFEASCPTCQKSHRLLDELDGKTIRCKGCGKSFRAEMPQDEDEEEEVAEPAQVAQVREKKVPPRPLEIADAEDEKKGAETALVPEVKEKKPEPQPLELLDAEDVDDEPILAREINEDLPVPRRAVVNGERPRESGSRSKARADEDVPEPRRRVRKRAKSSVPVALVAILGGVCFVLCLGCVGVGGGIWWFSKSSMALDLGGTWPEPLPIPQDNVVRFHIAGVKDDWTREVIMVKINLIVDKVPGKTSSGAWENERMVYLIRPCADPNACAQKVNFGKVRNVSGNIITVVVDPKDNPEAKNATTVALFMLKNGDKGMGFLKLQTIAPNEERGEVVKLMQSMLTDSDGFTRANAVEMLGKWGSKEQVPALIGMLKDQDPHVRGRTIDVLAKLKDPRVIDPIADRLHDFFDRGPATKALKEFGPAAEPALIACLGHLDKDVKVAACNILKTVGSRQCVPALQKLATSEDFFVSNAAKDALRACQSK